MPGSELRHIGISASLGAIEGRGGSYTRLGVVIVKASL
jgi:hypothetical protein